MSDEQAFPANPPPGAYAGPVEEAERRRKAAKKTSIRIPALNITSFLDMSFCLLTFLILSANFAVGEGSLTSNLPASGGAGGDAPAAQAPPLVILVETVGNRASLTVEGYNRPINSCAELTKFLTELRKTTLKDNGEVMIQPNAQTRWEHVTDAFNAVLRAKCPKVGFAPIRG